jgi:hypothetical protein
VKLPKELFWDINNWVPDFDKSAIYIIERVIERGGWRDWKEIMNYYGKKKVKDVVLQMRYIPKRRHHFLGLYFNVPIQKFRCYTWQQLNPEPSAY